MGYFKIQQCFNMNKNNLTNIILSGKKSVYMHISKELYLVVVVQHCECNQSSQTVHLKMVKMVDFMSYIFFKKF